MMSLGVFCIVSGAGTVAASLRAPRQRQLFEVMGGGLLVVGLGFAGAAFALVA